MSAAHTCFRSVLTQAFRLSNCRGVASSSIPDFLIPAVTRGAHRPFSAKRRRAEVHSFHETINPQYKDSVSVNHPPRPIRESIRSQIPFPSPHARGDIRQWLAAIDPFLPPHLRRRPSDNPDVSSSVTPLDFAGILIAAREDFVDILSHIGLVEQRWDTAVWIAKKLVEDRKKPAEAPTRLEPSANVIWPETEPRSLDDLTNSSLLTQRVRPSRKLRHSLDNLTSIPETIDMRYRLVQAGLGQLWQSLASMILVCAEGGHNEADLAMHHILEIIAYLHHVGLIPDSVYTHKSSPDEHALQQPPTLPLLSSKILTALSDATWRAHEASVKVATERLNASYFLGHEIPGSRYKISVTEVASELWLELILWSCLHGGWILDGSAILQRIMSDKTKPAWGLISWRELLQAREQEPADSSGWGLFPRREEISAKAKDRARTRKAISSEVVTAFIDGLVNNMRLGVGARGTTPEDLVERITELKEFLDVNSLSLGSATWDSIMSRLLESGGIVPERRPELLLQILDLASGFGKEVSTLNATPRAITLGSEPPYFFEPTTVPLSLLHRTIRSFIGNGDIAGAMTTLKALQQYTDGNKQKSLEQFFEILKSVPLRYDEPFTSSLPPIEFPAFDTQLPVPLLAKLLDLSTDSKMYDLGRWLLFSEDIDGPLIHSGMYANWTMAAAIIRFGTMAGENDLVLEIIERHGKWSNDSQNQHMPHEFLTALMCCQIKLHRWQSLRGMQDYALESPGYRPRPEILAHLGAELLRSSSHTNEEQPPENIAACRAFQDFLFAWEDLVLTHLTTELYCVLAILSTVHKEWYQYCSQYLATSNRHGISLSTDNFNQVLGGVLDGYGSRRGKEIVDIWCYKPPKTFEPYRAPGGLSAMPKFRTGKGQEYEDQPDNIEIVQPSGAKLVLVGRVHPNRQTVWAVVRKVQQEEDDRRHRNEEVTIGKRAEVRETLRWAARLLYYMGFDYEEITRDLGGLAELAELEAPPAPSGVDSDGALLDSKEPGL